MTNPLSALRMGAAILFATLYCAARLSAATPPLPAASADGPDQPLARLQAAVSPVDTLRQAYIILSAADHDYKGHRVKAMKAIEAACTLLGTNISGDGKGHEKQPISDVQLRQALSLVQQAEGQVPAGKGQKKILAHLDKAISELNIALTIR